ncbi:hypothetical protein ACRRTK_005303 [Alexandromys fortis]
MEVANAGSRMLPCSLVTRKDTKKPESANSVRLATSAKTNLRGAWSRPVSGASQGVNGLYNWATSQSIASDWNQWMLQAVYPPQRNTAAVNTQKSPKPSLTLLGATGGRCHSVAPVTRGFQDVIARGGHHPQGGIHLLLQAPPDSLEPSTGPYVPRRNLVSTLISLQCYTPVLDLFSVPLGLVSQWGLCRGSKLVVLVLGDLISVSCRGFASWGEIQACKLPQQLQPSPKIISGCLSLRRTPATAFIHWGGDHDEGACSVSSPERSELPLAVQPEWEQSVPTLVCRELGISELNGTCELAFDQGYLVKSGYSGQVPVRAQSNLAGPAQGKHLSSAGLLGSKCYGLPPEECSKSSPNRHAILIVRVDLLAQVSLEVQSEGMLNSAKPCAFFSLYICYESGWLKGTPSPSDTEVDRNLVQEAHRNGIIAVDRWAMDLEGKLRLGCSQEEKLCSGAWSSSPVKPVHQPPAVLTCAHSWPPLGPSVPGEVTGPEQTETFGPKTCAYELLELKSCEGLLHPMHAPKCVKDNESEREKQNREQRPRERVWELLALSSNSHYGEVNLDSMSSTL